MTRIKLTTIGTGHRIDSSIGPGPDPGGRMAKAELVRLQPNPLCPCGEIIAGELSWYGKGETLRLVRVILIVIRSIEFAVSITSVSVISGQSVQ